MSATISERSTELESHKGWFHIEAVTLTVRDLDRIARFYCDVVGLTVIAEMRNRIDLGNDGVVLLTLLGDANAEPAQAGSPGLFHTAFVLPSRADLGQWLASAMANQWEIEGASDHLVSEAIYLSDPEGNGIEIYCDRARSAWRNADGNLRMANSALDGQDLLNLAPQSPGKTFAMPSGGRIGHVHLCVNDLKDASRTMEDQFGLTEMHRYPDAYFFGANGYHHHIATNTWRTTGRQERRAGQLGLAEVTIAMADEHLTRWQGRERLTALDGLSFAAVAFA
jgi:catechol 2,3-dioxygenase